MKKILMMAFLAGAVVFTGCGGDDEEKPDALTLVSISAAGTDVLTGEATTVDLNGASAAAGVPIDVVVTLTFSREVDAATVTSTAIAIDGVDATVSVTGAAVTMTPSQELTRGTDYVLTIDAITASDGGEFVSTTRTFSTGGVAPVTPPNEANQVAYWDFDGDANDKEGTNNPTAEIAIEYQADRHGQASSAAYFDGDESIIEYPNGSAMTNAEQFTISFWVKTNTTDHVNADGNLTGMFVFGLGAFNGIQYEIFGNYDGSKFAISYENEAGETFGEDMWFPNGATDNTNGGWQGWTYARNLSLEEMQGIIKDEWYHVIYTFNGSERTGTLYFNGELMKSFDFDLWPADGAKATTKALKYRGAEPDVVDELALGFIQSRAGTMWDDTSWGGYEFATSNHFKGWLDDFRIFHAAFSQDDAEALYNAEKP